MSRVDLDAVGDVRRGRRDRVGGPVAPDERLPRPCRRGTGARATPVTPTPRVARSCRRSGATITTADADERVARGRLRELRVRAAGARRQRPATHRDEELVVRDPRLERPSKNPSSDTTRSPRRDRRTAEYPSAIRTAGRSEPGIRVGDGAADRAPVADLDVADRRQGVSQRP